MFFISSEVGPFRSINKISQVKIEDTVTVLVGMNEAGKTVFLKSLEKSDDVLGIEEFEPVADYPRKDLSEYLKRHESKPDQVTKLTYKLTDDEIDLLNEELHIKVQKDFTFSVCHLYDNGITIVIKVDESPVLESLISSSKLSTAVVEAIKETKSIRKIPELVTNITLTDDDKLFIDAIKTRIAKTKWESIVQYEIWEWLKTKIPKFLYFGEYELLPSKTNLTDLAQRNNDPTRLRPEDRAVLALLRMADITINDFTKSSGYESLKAKIEAVSIKLTDQIMEFWKQNESLEVEIDIKEDRNDELPFNNGPNLYLRIKNLRHRGVSTPFRQRSRGFIWFFSFLVWFDSVQHQLATGKKYEERDLILLLDEPGLSLHALAQKDLLSYIDNLSKRHQVLYTTHSPFMVHSDRLYQVRMVEDKDKVGTIITDNISSSDPKTIFPLQAALGWTIAQNLFISERNLLVEGPSELVYLKAISAILENKGRTGLHENITIVPAGGLDKVATFISLLGASGLKLAVLYDYRGTPDQRLEDLVKQKIVSSKVVLNVSQFRDKSGRAADIEDLFTPVAYIEYFNKTFSTTSNIINLQEKDLPEGDQIIDRIERHLETVGTKIRPSGGFNHYLVASFFISTSQIPDNDTLDRFETLFVAVNKIFYK